MTVKGRLARLEATTMAGARRHVAVFSHPCPQAGDTWKYCTGSPFDNPCPITAAELEALRKNPDVELLEVIFKPLEEIFKEGYNAS